MVGVVIRGDDRKVAPRAKTQNKYQAPSCAYHCFVPAGKVDYIWVMAVDANNAYRVGSGTHYCRKRADCIAVARIPDKAPGLRPSNPSNVTPWFGCVQGFGAGPPPMQIRLIAC